MDPNLFPKDFMWGASTSSHQVEGGTENQWTEWELANATELAKMVPKRISWLPNWKSVKPDATDPENYISGRGIEHYKRYEEDFDLLEELHLNSFRFSIEWSRINPKEGAWNLEGIKHYHHYIDSLNKRGIEPILNIWHWTMPTWFTEKGGFEKKANLVFFDQFVEKIVEEYGKDVRYILTLNEPNIYSVVSYLTSEWPPQQRSIWKCLKVYWNLMQAHKRAYDIIKRIEPAIQVGVAQNMRNEKSAGKNDPISPIVAYMTMYVWNRWFINRIKHKQDFIGINFYNSEYVRGFVHHNPKTPLSDVGWYMEPEGLLPVLVQTYARYKKPIMITENGLADEKDRFRKWWITQTLVAMQRAISQDVELIGYMHWSLLDNFEWSHGWWPKFGLVAVDRENDMKRTIRPSAKWFANYLKKLDRYQVVRAKAHGRKSGTDRP
ncbi:MAG TPA: family 1 glycosylhydrolase [Candidatus Saccharimonadales bacterium]|nr:family 1 glycosylhydrolase [Candidatus Saccharimonadales bacterium]